MTRHTLNVSFQTPLAPCLQAYKATAEKEIEWSLNQLKDVHKGF